MQILSDLKCKNFISLISRLTILFAGLKKEEERKEKRRANFELDLKKVVAYSTLRQLGFVIRILSIDSIELVFLFIRAIFKSLIFIFVYIQNIRLYGIYYIYPLKRIIIISRSAFLSFA